MSPLLQLFNAVSSSKIFGGDTKADSGLHASFNIDTRLRRSVSSLTLAAEVESTPKSPQSKQAEPQILTLNPSVNHERRLSFGSVFSDAESAPTEQDIFSINFESW